MSHFGGNPGASKIFLLKRVIEAGKDADNKNLSQLFQPIFVQSHFKISAFLTPLTFLVAMNKKNNVQLL